MSLEADIGCLRSLPLFRDMPASRLKLVALMGERLRFEPGAVLIDQKDRLDGVYVILEGDVEFSQPREDGEVRRFQKDAGSITGDVSLLSGRPFIGTVSAKTPVLALRIPKDLFFELLQTVPEFSLAVCRDLAERVHRLASVLLREHETV
ncbi:Crp/Fnr family transcriptional regulator [Bosea sp. F3-2]|uniref:Crp/Fnr family transcriptional regulator n=1 Tax=Bosea sp. F3-2 TaxID=2599640 RepID=UPI0011EDC0A1|nr:Crp/Fnr family transcriptional regulator [Bosea sp. F3-2]QEL25360.1 Crp/Fnr family transcriptional regulator [Bosea sp. F3-2]